MIVYDSKDSLLPPLYLEWENSELFGERGIPMDHHSKYSKVGS
jgi:hypothetical protein